MEALHKVFIQGFETRSGKILDIPLSYQVFGRPLHTAPLVVVNHALTGNSAVAGENGWWKTLIGEGKPIDTDRFTILCFNIPGNGYDGFFIDDYQEITAYDIAKIFLLGLERLSVNKIDVLIGGSLGGAIAWEMLSQKPDLAEKFVPVATDYKTTDWLHSQCLVQKFLLASETNPLQKARIHAMLFYRTPESLNERFRREREREKNGILKSHDWLNYHGMALYNRFDIRSYHLMNYLLMHINADENILPKITADIHLVAIDTDWLFPASEVKKTYDLLKKEKQNVYYHEIKSPHGHDAFLINYDQLEEIVNEVIK